jgi:mono/diheme cytochrome c family protein
MRLRPSLIVLPVIAVALLASGCFESKSAGTISTPITVNVGTTETEVNPAATTGGAPATTSASTSTAGSTSSSSTTSTSGTTTPAYPASAKATFVSTCGGCHTLANAGTHGTVGPNLDQLKPDDATVTHQIINGGGPMPAGLLKGQSLKDVAAYVSSVAGKSGSGTTSPGGSP